MFGEKDMIGKEVRVVDAKGRVILPKFSYAEEGNELIVYQDNDFISLFDKDYFLNLFKLRRVCEFENPESYLKWKNYLDTIFLNLELVTVDNQRRILLSRDTIDEYRLFHDVYIVGVLDHVNIYGNSYVKKKKM